MVARHFQGVPTEQGGLGIDIFQRFMGTVLGIVAQIARPLLRKIEHGPLEGARKLSGPVAVSRISALVGAFRVVQVGKALDHLYVRARRSGKAPALPEWTKGFTASPPAGAARTPPDRTPQRRRLRGAPRPPVRPLNAPK